MRLNSTCDPHWLAELESPSEGFFRAFVHRVKSGGARCTAREAVCFLTPRVHWEGYLPQVPHGLLGLWAVFRLEPWLDERRFLRLLGGQLHAFASEARSPGLLGVSPGSGHWENLRLAFDRMEPRWAWGEALAVEEPRLEDFHRLARWAAPDMASMGHKLVFIHRLGDLAEMLDDTGEDRQARRMLLAIGAWLGASGPRDLFWHTRLCRRLGSEPNPLATGSNPWTPEAESLARGMTQWGLVELLNGFRDALRAGLGSGEVLMALLHAAVEKQLDARRELEGKTAWNVVYLASVAALMPRDPLALGRAAALIHLFPSEEVREEPRKAWRQPISEVPLRELILDGDVREAMGAARELLDASDGGVGVERVLQELADAVAEDDPHGHLGYPLLALASAVELGSRLPSEATSSLHESLLIGLAKSFANARGSSDLAARVSTAIHGELGRSVSK